MAKENIIRKNIGWIALIIVVIILANKGMFGSKTTNYITNSEVTTNEAAQLNSQQTGACSLTFDKTSYCLGEIEKGTLNVNPGSYNIYFRWNNGDWQFVENVATDSAGYFSASRQLQVLGNYQFVALGGNPACLTNKFTFDVIDCSQPDEGTHFSGLPCSQVYNPNPLSCSEAYCPLKSQSCVYHKATLTTIAHCGCE